MCILLIEKPKLAHSFGVSSQKSMVSDKKMTKKLPKKLLQILDFRRTTWNFLNPRFRSFKKITKIWRGDGFTFDIILILFDFTFYIYFTHCHPISSWELVPNCYNGPETKSHSYKVQIVLI